MPIWPFASLWSQFGHVSNFISSILISPSPIPVLLYHFDPKIFLQNDRLRTSGRDHEHEHDTRERKHRELRAQRMVTLMEHDHHHGETEVEDRETATTERQDPGDVLRPGGWSPFLHRNGK